MCSRYELNSSAREIMAAFDLDAAPPTPNKPEVRPTDLALTVSGDGKAEVLPWGLEVSWSKQPMINARAETLDEKPTFKPLLESRCVVPASGYFEWRTAEDGKKRKNRIWTGDGPIFAMAGLTDGKRFTVVTCTPAPAIDHIHGRMPVILPPEAVATWLSGKPYADVAATLLPYEGSLLFEEEKPPPPAQGDLFG